MTRRINTYRNHVGQELTAQPESILDTTLAADPEWRCISEGSPATGAEPDRLDVVDEIWPPGPGVHVNPVRKQALPLKEVH